MSWFSDFEGVRPHEQSDGVEFEPLERFELSPGECNYLSQIEGLTMAGWAEIPVSGRLSALRELEARLADIEGRPVVEIRPETLPSGTSGYYDRNQGVMSVSTALLEAREPFEAIDTVAHEGRHAYQHYAIEHEGTHDDADEVEAWRTNFADYLPAAIYGYEEYRDQPVEADAWRYGEMVRAIFENQRGW